jgi:hypothetical protein
MLACARNGGPSRRRWRCLAPRRRRTYHGAPMPAPHAYDALEAYRGTGTERSRDDGVSTPVDVERCLASDVARRDATRAAQCLPVVAARGSPPFGRISTTPRGNKQRRHQQYITNAPAMAPTPLHSTPLRSSRLLLSIDRDGGTPGARAPGRDARAGVPRVAARRAPPRAPAPGARLP